MALSASAASKKLKKNSFKVGKKGSKSKTHKGDKNFTTKKGDMDYHEGGHDQKKAKKPYSGMKKVGKKASSGKKKVGKKTSTKKMSKKK